MKINSNAQNFKGFSNLIYQDLKEPHGRISMLAMKLDDTGENEQGKLYRDKTIFNEYKSIYNITKDKNSDIITIFYDKIDNYPSLLLIDTEPLYWGSELKNLQYKLNERDYKVIEQAHLKIFTLIASLTKRIEECRNFKYDNDFDRVAIATRDVIFKITKNYNNTLNFLISAIENPYEEPATIAKFFNNKILKTMQIFFK